jgi:putative ABC transport system permease protein
MRQVASLTMLGLRTIPRRSGMASLIVISISGVVAVLVAVLSMVEGLNHAMQGSGRPDTAIVLRAGAVTEMGSVLTLDAVHRLGNSPDVKRDSQGKPLVSAEMVRLVSLQRVSDGADINTVVRGVQDTAFTIRPELKIVAGRHFKSGTAEMLVGRSAQEQFKNLNIGDTVFAFDQTWTVVGVFASANDSHESELLVDSSMLSSTIPFQSATVELVSPQAFTSFKSYLTSDRASALDVYTEREYLRRQSRVIAGLISVLTYVVGTVMALGAIFAVINSMYYAINVRAKEIAILRAVGFGYGATATAVVLETLLLSFAGALLGAGLAWLLISGRSVTTAVGMQLANQLAFHLVVDGHLILVGVIWALAIGLIGGIFPALRAARLPVAVALRAL